MKRLAIIPILAVLSETLFSVVATPAQAVPTSAIATPSISPYGATSTGGGVMDSSPTMTVPAGETARVLFGLSAPGEAELAIYDVSRRLVRILIRGDLGAGPHLATWDGRDDAGRPVAPGTYLMSLKTGGRLLSQRVVRTR
jgi:flagellar hook assembly protein FlgD